MVDAADLARTRETRNQIPRNTSGVDPASYAEPVTGRVSRPVPQLPENGGSGFPTRGLPTMGDAVRGAAAPAPGARPMAFGGPTAAPTSVAPPRLTDPAYQAFLRGQTANVPAGGAGVAGEQLGGFRSDAAPQMRAYRPGMSGLSSTVPPRLPPGGGSFTPPGGSAPPPGGGEFNWLPVLGEALNQVGNYQAVNNPHTLGDRFIKQGYENPGQTGGLDIATGKALNMFQPAVQAMGEIAHAGAPAMDQASRAWGRGRPLEAAMDVGKAAYNVGKSALVDHGAKPLWDAFYGAGDQIYNAIHPQPEGPPMSAAPITMDRNGNFSRAPSNQAEYDQVMAMKYGPNRQQVGAEGSADSPFPAQARPQRAEGGRGMVAPRESAEAYANRAQAEIDRRRPETMARNRDMAEAYALSHPNERGSDKVMTSMGHLRSGQGSQAHSLAQASTEQQRADANTMSARAQMRGADAQYENAKRPVAVDPMKQQQSRVVAGLLNQFDLDRQSGMPYDSAMKRLQDAYGNMFSSKHSYDETLQDLIAAAQARAGQ